MTWFAPSCTVYANNTDSAQIAALYLKPVLYESLVLSFTHYSLRFLYATFCTRYDAVLKEALYIHSTTQCSRTQVTEVKDKIFSSSISVHKVHKVEINTQYIYTQYRRGRGNNLSSFNHSRHSTRSIFTEETVQVEEIGSSAVLGKENRN